MLIAFVNIHLVKLSDFPVTADKDAMGLDRKYSSASPNLLYEAGLVE